MGTQRLLAVTVITLSLLGQATRAQQVFDSQRLRFRTEVVTTGLKQPSAMIFLPDNRALVVERQNGVDLLDLKSGTLTPVDGGAAHEPSGGPCPAGGAKPGRLYLHWHR